MTGLLEALTTHVTAVGGLSCVLTRVNLDTHPPLTHLTTLATHVTAVGSLSCVLTQVNLVTPITHTPHNSEPHTHQSHTHKLHTSEPRHTHHSHYLHTSQHSITTIATTTDLSILWLLLQVDLG